MSRKDYIAIAEVINREVQIANAVVTQELRMSVITAIATGIADHMQKDNPQFNRAKFLSACGYPA